MALAKPMVATRALLVATLAQIASSIAISLLIGFQASVFASVIGGATLVLAGYFALARLLDRVDYVLYQAY